jgi:DNA-binding MarR family transcriptional regulator
MQPRCGVGPQTVSEISVGESLAAVETVARLSRNMGAHRQGVQRIINELAKEGLIEFRPNPHHRRANLVALSARGRDIYEQADRLQIPWINTISKDIDPHEIALATRFMQTLRRRLEEQGKQEPENGD